MLADMPPTVLGRRLSPKQTPLPNGDQQHVPALAMRDLAPTRQDTDHPFLKHLFASRFTRRIPITCPHDSQLSCILSQGNPWGRWNDGCLAEFSSWCNITPPNTTQWLSEHTYTDLCFDIVSRRPFTSRCPDTPYRDRQSGTYPCNATRAIREVASTTIPTKERHWQDQV